MLLYISCSSSRIKVYKQICKKSNMRDKKFHNILNIGEIVKFNSLYVGSWMKYRLIIDKYVMQYTYLYSSTPPLVYIIDDVE